MIGIKRQQRISEVVIVGGGFGGLRVARSLARAPVHVTLIDKSNHHLFQPLLYQVATAGLSPADIAYPIRSVLSDQKNAEVVMGEVIAVDPLRQQIRTADKIYPYDFLVLATGARHGYFGHDEWENFAPGLKTISDAVQIRQKILVAFEKAEKQTELDKRAALLTFVLVGGGPTGVEMAGAIAELAHRALASDFRRIDPRSARVILLEAGPRVLSSFPEKLSRKAAEALMALGVEVRTGAKVESVDSEGVIVNGKRIYSPTVLWTAGVVASPIAKWLGLDADRAGRVKVNPDLTVPGHSDIYVIGDAACVYEKNGKVLPGTAPVAMQEGKYVASAIVEKLDGGTPRPFRYWDKGNLATIGRTFAIADIGKVHLSGWPAWAVWVVVHIYYLIGFRNRLLVLMQWAWAYITFQRGARLITLPYAAEEVRRGGDSGSELNRPMERRDTTTPDRVEKAPDGAHSAPCG